MPKYEIIGQFIMELQAETEDEARRIILGNLEFNLGIDPKQTVLKIKEMKEVKPMYDANLYPVHIEIDTVVSAQNLYTAMQQAELIAKGAYGTKSNVKITFDNSQTKIREVE